MNVIAIIPARGGSKGIPKKNIMDFCGKPLVAWTIEQALASKYIKDVYVSTDDNEIAEVSKKYGAKVVRRPDEISGDNASSESALLHALGEIEKEIPVDLIVFLQATSPLREKEDIDKAIDYFLKTKADSLLSASRLEDFFMWKKVGGVCKSINYDYNNRKRRQDIEPTFLENGSIYIFTPNLLKKENNRLGGKIEIFEMNFWKSFQIDDYGDVDICEFFMRKNILSCSYAENI